MHASEYSVNRVSSLRWSGSLLGKAGESGEGIICDKAGKEVIVPRGDFALEAEAVLSGRPADQVEGHVLDGGEIGGGVISAHAALVVTEDHVHDPVEAVLDGPMGTNDRSKLGG